MKPEDLGQLMEQARQVQTRLASLQQELATRRFEGSSGGGMVTAVATGALRIVELRIEPSLGPSGDHSMLQDRTAAAVNAALMSAQTTVQEDLQRASAGLTLPGAPTPD